MFFSKIGVIKFLRGKNPRFVRKTFQRTNFYHARVCAHMQKNFVQKYTSEKRFYMDLTKQGFCTLRSGGIL